MVSRTLNVKVTKLLILHIHFALDIVYVFLNVLGLSGDVHVGVVGSEIGAGVY